MNSLRRLCHAKSIGFDSVDGTLLAYGPDRHLPALLRWLAAVNETPPPAAAGTVEPGYA